MQSLVLEYPSIIAECNAIREICAKVPERQLRHRVCRCISSPAFAWGAKGHQIVALIAEAHLDAGTQDKIKAILPKNQTLAKAAIWPDEARKALPQMNPLHYVDVPKGATAYDRERDCPQRNCIVEAIPWYVNVLKSPDSPRAEKQLALDYLVHLVGDLHLPLMLGFSMI